MTALCLSSIAAFVLGLLAGSLLLEALVLVPFFKKLNPEEFFSFHPIFGRQLFRYFAPLTSLAVFTPCISAIWAGGSNIGLNISAATSLIVLLFFPFYFKGANDAFSNGQVSAGELPDRLAQWGKVHNVRTMIAMAAFGSAVFGVHAIN
jgi:Domain of unknown function (DUF1772)